MLRPLSAKHQKDDGRMRRHSRKPRKDTSSNHQSDKPGRLLDTLPERLALARAESLPPEDFLTLLLSAEVERRDRSSAELRARAAKLDRRCGSWRPLAAHRR